MKKLIFVLLAIVVCCSGQMCGSTATNTGPQNICGRNFFEPNYRIGIDLPAGIGLPKAGSIDSNIALKQTWDWATNPVSKVVLVVSAPVGDVTLDQAAQESQATFEQNNFTVMVNMQVTLDDGSNAWYFALSPNDQDNINVEAVMTLSQGRLVMLSATYASSLPKATTDAINAMLQSLCVDVQ